MVSMKKKLFAVIEQGCDPYWRLSREHRKQFTTEYSDFFRLNWKDDHSDTFATHFGCKLSWSEGRSLVYDSIKDNYLYFIFIDDDIKFESKTNNSVSQELKLILEKYKPVHASILNTTWPKIKHVNSEVFPMIGGDLCVQIFHFDFAKQMFPTLFHGSGKSMWYAQYIAFNTNPQRSIFINSIKASNERSDPHQDEKSLFNFNLIDPGTIQLLKFATMLKLSLMPPFINWFSFVNTNSQSYSQIPVSTQSKYIHVTRSSVLNNYNILSKKFVSGPYFSPLRRVALLFLLCYYCVNKIINILSLKLKSL